MGTAALDIAGFVPVIGAAADLTNAAWYAAEGDYANAALSGISAIPGLGDAVGAVAKGGKVVAKVSKGNKLLTGAGKLLPNAGKVIAKVTKGNKLLAGAGKLLPNAGKLTDLAKLTKKIPGKLGEVVKKIPLPNKVKNLVKGAVKYGVPVAVHGVNVAGFVGGVGAAQEYIKKGDYVNAALVIVSGSAGLGHTVKSVGKLGKGKINGVENKEKGSGNSIESVPANVKEQFNQLKNKLLDNRVNKTEKKINSLGKGLHNPNAIIGTNRTVKLGKQTHTLSIRQVGNRISLWLCSNCGELIQKLDNLLLRKDLRPKVKKQLEELRERADGLNEMIDNGWLSPDDISEQLSGIKGELEELAPGSTLEARSQTTPEPSEIDSAVDVPETQNQATGPTQHPPGTKFKTPRSGISGKERANNIPSWVLKDGYGYPTVGESGNDYATRVMNGQYGKGNYDKGAHTEFNQIRKWADRNFE